jgi:phosphohistidine phosphatase
MLLIVRHGRAEKDHPGPDEDRPLTGQGRRDIHRLGEWLATKAWLPDAILSSPSVRTEETVSTLLGVWGREEDLSDDEFVIWDDRIYEATLENLLDVLREQADDHRCVLLAGHNPGLTELVEHLVAEEPAHSATGKVLTPGAVAVLRMPEHWETLPRACAGLVDLQRPG